MVKDTSKIKYVIGIDFGHGETSAAYAEIGNVPAGRWYATKDIDLADGNPVIPSAMAICPDGEVLLGDEAVDASLTPENSFYVGFKTQPSKMTQTDETLMGKYMNAVYKLIRERAGATFTDSNHLVFIASPSGWSHEEQNKYQKIAENAGLPIGGIYYESRAAMIEAESQSDTGLPQYVDKGAIVFDMGSSTLDFSYICNVPQSKDKGYILKPKDNGYPCGAARVEEAMFEYMCQEYEEVRMFKERYPQALGRTLFELRKAKEDYFKKKIRKCRAKIDPLDLIGDTEFGCISHVFNTGDIENILERIGYVDEIRRNMKEFATVDIKGKPIHAVFFTGGASRMPFLEELVKEVWNCKLRPFRDQNPSLTISRGIAEAARRDIGSGGKEHVKEKLNEIMAKAGDIYEVFAGKLSEKLESEIRASIATPVCSFQESEEDYSLADLESSISNNIESDMENVKQWSQECMEDTFKEATDQIRADIGSIMSNYSRANVEMGSISGSCIDLPEIDMDIISDQISGLAETFTESASGLSDIITGAAVGIAAAFLTTGPLGWIAGAGYLAYKWFLSENESEEEKREKDKNKDLDKESRQKVYDEFANKWDDICEEIHEAVSDALDDDATRKAVNRQCNAVLQSYAEECLRKTRLMID